MAKQKLVSKLSLYAPLAAAQFLGKGLGAFKDILIAFFLGISVYTDAYFLFLAVPGYLVTLFSSPIVSLLVPELSALDETKRAVHAYKYAKVFSRFSLIVTSLLFIVGGLYLGFVRINTSGFEWTCFILMCSILPFSCSAQILISYFSIHKKFKNLALFTILNPLLSFLVFLSLVKIMGYWALPFSFLAGFSVEGLVAIFYLRQKSQSHIIPDLFKTFDGFFKEYTALIFSAVFLGSATVVDNFMIAGMGEEGGVTSYSFGIKFVAVFLSLSIFPVNQIIFPKLSNLYSGATGVSSFKSFYYKSLSALFIYGLLAFAGFYILGRFVIEIFYLRGKVSQADVQLIVEILYAYSLQIPFFLSGVLAAKVLSVLRLNRFLLYISMVSLALNIILNYVLILKYGVAGVALSTSAVYLVSFVLMLLVFLNKSKGLLNEK